MSKNTNSSDASMELGEATPVPRHIAIIMDGNGRWARARLLPRVEGHRAGAKTVRMVVEECRRIGVRYLTVFAFSTENWGRPKDEVSTLMKLFKKYLDGELETLLKNDIRLRSIGDRKKLPDFVQQALVENEERTKHCTGMDLVLAISYGGREEIVSAAREICTDVQNGKINTADICEDLFKRHLYAPDIPDPDLLIRTSNENRISNFLLWQLAYAEIVVSPLNWPEFSKQELFRCLGEYTRRNRRFGLTEEQIRQQGTTAA